MQPEILHLERDFLVCVKPHGIPSQPDMSGDEDMTEITRKMLKEMNEQTDLFVVHRLDRTTGGVILYARNKKAAAELSRSIADKDIFKKEYLAVVSGAPEESTGHLTDYIYRDGTQKKAFIVKSERKGAKSASLDYTVISSVISEGNIFSLLSVRLNTGRFHQIRVQFASRGMPIWGDGKYGSRQRSPHIALWAEGLEFDHRDKHYRFSKEPDTDELPWSLFK